MLEFIKGEIIETTPAYLVLQNNGLGYFINISLNTYSGISEKKECLLYVNDDITGQNLASSSYILVNSERIELR